MLGDFSDERVDLSSVGHDFGWSVAQTSDLSGLRDIAQSRTIIAVLIQAGALGIPWSAALRAARAAAPQARIIVCHKAEQIYSRTQMVDSGAFGAVLSPLAYSEIRQSLGFVWASKITPLEHGLPSRKACLIEDSGDPDRIDARLPRDAQAQHVGAA